MLQFGEHGSLYKYGMARLCTFTLSDPVTQLCVGQQSAMKSMGEYMPEYAGGAVICMYLYKKRCLLSPGVTYLSMCISLYHIKDEHR